MHKRGGYISHHNLLSFLLLLAVAKMLFILLAKIGLYMGIRRQGLRLLESHFYSHFYLSKV